jgi:hypothetical protein
MMRTDSVIARPKMPATLLCQHIGIHRRTLSRWVLDAELDFPKPSVIHGRWYFDPREIEDFMLRRRAVADHEAKKAAESKPAAAKQAEAGDKTDAKAQAKPKPKAKSRTKAKAPPARSRPGSLAGAPV